MHRSSDSVVTSAAYLLFYRRRTPYPLGPRYLKQLVEQTWAEPEDGDTASEQSSRPASPSGQGKARGLDDSSPSGSSSAFTHGAGATHRLGPTSEVKGQAGMVAKSGNDDELPPYEDIDEAIGMEDEADDGDRVLYGPEPPPLVHLESLGHTQHHGLLGNDPWDFSKFDAERNLNPYDSEAGADIDDVASNEAANGDFDDGGDGNERLMEDFGDDMAGQLHFGSSSSLRHAPSPTTRMEEDFMADNHVTDAEDASAMLIGDEDEEDVPVAVVLVDGSSESGHMKTD